jgi:hypothetical protein
MNNRVKQLVLAAIAALTAGPAAYGFAPEGAPGLLQTLERGLWQLRAVGSASGAASTQLCLGDPKLLAQIQHGSSSCTQLVVGATR